MYLGFHLLSHLLLGMSTAWLLLPRRTPRERLLTLSAGAVSAVLPDLLGGRATNLWSHSLIAAPLIVLVVAIPAYRLLGDIRFRRVWCACTLAEWMGHLLLDIMDHEVVLLYPLNSAAFRVGAITLGDPFIWVPLLAAIPAGIVMRSRRRLPVLLGVCGILFYMALRITAMERILHLAGEDMPQEETAHVTVEPNTHNEYKLWSRDWLEYRFSILSAHHLMGGYAGMQGEELGRTQWHVFYPEGQQIRRIDEQWQSLPRSGNSADSLSVTVLKEWEEGGYSYLKGEAADHQIHVFRHQDGGDWEEQRQ